MRPRTGSGTPAVFEALDEPVDHDEPQPLAVAKRLLRDAPRGPARTRPSHRPRSRPGPRRRSPRPEWAAHQPPLERRSPRHLRQGAFDRDAGHRDREPVRARWSLEARLAGEDHGAAERGRRAEGSGVIWLAVWAEAALPTKQPARARTARISNGGNSSASSIPLTDHATSRAMTVIYIADCVIDPTPSAEAAIGWLKGHTVWVSRAYRFGGSGPNCPNRSGFCSENVFDAKLEYSENFPDGLFILSVSPSEVTRRIHVHVGWPPDCMLA